MYINGVCANDSNVEPSTLRGTILQVQSQLPPAWLFQRASGTGYSQKQPGPRTPNEADNFLVRWGRYIYFVSLDIQELK